MEEFDTLGQIETPSGCELYTSKMKYLFESKGLSNEDSRIKNIIKEIDELKSKGQDITFEKFKSLIKSSYTFIRNLLHNNLIIKDYDDFKERVDHLYQNVKNDDMGGYIPASSPQLSKVDPEGFAVSICTVDGQRLNFGDVNTYVWMHQITSVVSYLNALQEHGSEVVSSYIGTEPSGQSFDSLELLKSVPHNPLISSGILTWCSLLYQEDTIDRKYEKYAQQVQRLIGGKKVHFNNEMYLSEIKRADRNYWLLYMLQEENTLPPKSDVKQIMQLYTQTCSIELELKDYAVLAASLANGGICPLTEDRVYSDPDAVKGVLSQMLCWGMNTFSGKWAFKWGLPWKSSVSGVTILVIPNTLGVAVWSPKLDKYHNSQKGWEFLSKFVSFISFTYFTSLILLY